VWLVLVGVAACSPSVTSVDGNKNVKDLSPSDGEQLCHDIVNYVENNLSSDELARVACGFSSTSSGSCQADFDKCVSSIHVTTPIPGTAECSGFEQTLKSCNVTVDQYTTCLEQVVSAFGKLSQEVPLCSQQAEEQAFIGIEGDLSAECLQLFQSCNLGFGTSTSSGGTP
jgi:hypothetical protein